MAIKTDNCLPPVPWRGSFLPPSEPRGLMLLSGVTPRPGHDGPCGYLELLVSPRQGRSRSRPLPRRLTADVGRTISDAPGVLNGTVRREDERLLWTWLSGPESQGDTLAGRVWGVYEWVESRLRGLLESWGRSLAYGLSRHTYLPRDDANRRPVYLAALPKGRTGRIYVLPPGYPALDGLQDQINEPARKAFCRFADRHQLSTKFTVSANAIGLRGQEGHRFRVEEADRLAVNVVSQLLGPAYAAKLA